MNDHVIDKFFSANLHRIVERDFQKEGLVRRGIKKKVWP